MFGQAISISGKKYNVIILAGGLGTRMGTASDFIPKALTKFGDKRAIDFIIERYSNVAHKFIIGTSYHADLLESYIKGQYPLLPIEFSYQPIEQLKTNFVSTSYCLDHADSRYGTIITFCDLIMLSNNVINDDTLYYVTDTTEGNIGSFRHSLDYKDGMVQDIIIHESPIVIEKGKNQNGLIGTFIFGNTLKLKAITYSNFLDFNNADVINESDLTSNIIIDYVGLNGNFKRLTNYMRAEHCKSVLEFGDEVNLQKVRQQWEKV